MYTDFQRSASDYDEVFALLDQLEANARSFKNE